MFNKIVKPGLIATKCYKNMNYIECSRISWIQIRSILRKKI